MSWEKQNGRKNQNQTKYEEEKITDTNPHKGDREWGENSKIGVGEKPKARQDKKLEKKKIVFLVDMGRTKKLSRSKKCESNEKNQRAGTTAKRQKLVGGGGQMCGVKNEGQVGARTKNQKKTRGKHVT